MKITINRKYCKDADGPWLDIDNFPYKVLLEADDGEGNPSGKPAFKFGPHIFHFGQAHDTAKKYRILALNTIVVCVQE